jgi:hypothetical protein
MNDKLEIYSVLEDDDFFQVNMSATKGLFSGATRCYNQRRSLMELAKSLEGFPKSPDHIVNYSNEQENFSFFTLIFSSNPAWKVNVRVKIANIISYSNAPKVHDWVEFDMAVEPAAIDSFVASLKVLATAEIGTTTAVLHSKLGC